MSDYNLSERTNVSNILSLALRVRSFAKL